MEEKMEREIEHALATAAGKKLLFQAMVSPVEIALEYKPIAKKLLEVDNLPQGALLRYARDIYVLYQSGGGIKSFEEWLEIYNEQGHKYHAVFEPMHPIRFNKHYDLGNDEYVLAFKRDNEGWLCSEGTKGPYGGEGKCSIQHVLSVVGPNTRAAIEAIGDLRDFKREDREDVRVEYEKLYGPDHID